MYSTTAVINMRDEPRLHFPNQLATRLLMDNVTYSGALPEWFETSAIDYVARGATLDRLAASYLNGAQPPAPYLIDIPKRDGKSNTWVVPRINDQIICQACVSVIAERVQAKVLDPARVFSSRLNSDPNQVALLEDQVSAWARFNAKMTDSCSKSECVLQLDLKEAFNSLRLARVRAFIDSTGVDATTSHLLGRMLEVFGAANGGMPFLNDSLFFLGNAYFSEVDRIVARQSPNFIRFVDDYKIFGSSRQALETEFSRIHQEVQDIGLDINERKVWLGSGEEYLKSVANQKYGKTQPTEYSGGATTQPGVLEPEYMLASISTTLEKPEDYLHQGYGRYQMAALRRMRVAAIYADSHELGISPSAQFASLLSKNADVVQKVCDRIEEYSRDNTNTWRLVWVLYLCKDIDSAELTNPTLKSRLDAALEAVRKSSTVVPVARLWAGKMPGYPGTDKSLAEIEELHSLDYLERGQRSYGG
jgi:hypothetical protein